MKEQIKDRMEVLLQYEIEARSLAKSTSSTATTSRTATSTAGQASSTTGKTSSPESGGREAAKADVLFNIDTGEGT